MSIAFDADCILCHLRRNIATARELGTEDQAIAFTRVSRRTSPSRS